MRHGSLFSGIGGFDLAAEWMGWENIFHCEWNPFGQKVLKHYWPNAESFSDITKADFTKYEGQIDILTGGFPCQPYSTAGKRKGKEDERHLWPQMLRAIREIAPRFVVGENVRGLTNWNGGLVFDEVCSELEALGYQVAPVIIPACGLGAPHKRERIWFVATNTQLYANGLRTERGMDMDGELLERREWEKKTNGFNNISENGFVTNSNGTGKKHNGGTNNKEKGEIWWNEKSDVLGELCGNGNATDTTSTGRGKNNRQGESRFNDQASEGNNWNNFPTQSPICGGDDGLPTQLDGITFSKWRAESIKGYGNAIVPQVALQIFKAIEKTINK